MFLVQLLGYRSSGLLLSKNKYSHPIFLEESTPALLTHQPRFLSVRIFLKRVLQVIMYLSFVVVGLLMFAQWAEAQTEPNAPDQGGIDQTEAGQFFIKTEAGTLEPALALESRAHLNISGLVAEVTLTQAFKNDTDEWVEGVYAFPLSDVAAVKRMRMIIGDRVIEGKIKEKGEAKKIYTEAKAAGKKASLVKQQRPNLFTSKVANIAPGESISVELQYVERVHYERGVFGLRFPMTITPRYIPGAPLLQEEAEQNLSVSGVSGASGWAVNTDQVPDASEITPFMHPPQRGQLINPITLTASLDMGMTLQSVESAYHDIQLTRQGQRYEVKLTEGRVSMNQDFELRWTPQLGKAPKAALFSQSLDGEDYGLLMVLPPLLQENGSHHGQQVLPKEVIYVIDTSGSMGGVSIRQARDSLLLALDKLQPQDRFNIIEFNSTAQRFFRRAVAATPANLAKARGYVAGLKAGGGTEMMSAAELALANPLLPAEAMTFDRHRVRQVLFITDGAVGNEAALFSTIEQKLGSSRLFTVGIGSAPNTHFMRKAAQFGRGSFTHIGDVSEVQEKMTALFNKIEQPMVTHLNVQWPSTRFEQLPARIPDLYQGEPLWLSAKINDLRGDVKVQGRVAGQQWQQTLTIDQVQDHKGVASLWAREKIAALLDEKVAGRDAQAVRTDVLAVALPHQLLSPYTSFVAVEEKISREPAEAAEKLSVKQVPNATPKGQAPQTMAYPKTATGAKASMLWGITVLLLMWVFSRVLRQEEDYELVR